MKNPYFKSVEIEKNIMKDFFQRHSELTAFVNPELPFYVRVSKKLYSGLIHTIISDNASNEQVINQWNQLNSFVKKVKAKRMVALPIETLTKIVGESKAKLINSITKNVMNKTLDLKLLARQSQETILAKLKQYQYINDDIINKFMLFTCFKQDVLCEQDPDLIEGMKILLKKEKINQEDINNIKIKYKGELTIFSLCMWRIRNERKGQ